MRAVGGQAACRPVDANIANPALNAQGCLMAEAKPELASLAALLAPIRVYVAREAATKARASGFEIVNVDATVILERPKIGPYKDAMRSNLAAALSIPPERVTLKGKTHEKVDAVGEGKAVEVHAVALLVRVK